VCESKLISNLLYY